MNNKTKFINIYLSENSSKRNHLRINTHYSHSDELTKFMQLNKKDLFSQDKVKYNRNNLYLNKLRKKVFTALYKKLNDIHKINYSSKYWEIILESWLIHFLDKTFYKFQRLNELIKSNKGSLYTHDYLPSENIVPSNYEALEDIYNNDEWDYIINLELIKFIFRNKIKCIKKNNNSLNISIKRKNKQHAKTFYFKKNLSSIYNKNDKIVFFKGHFGIIDLIELNSSFFQLPNRYEIKFKNEFVNLSSQRNILNLNFLIKNKFEEYLSKNIFNHLPSFFLEKFNYYNKSYQSFMPSKPKIIFNTNSLWWNTLLLFYTANMKQKENIKLLNYQHGCNYGLIDSLRDNHEIKTSNIFFTWGWSKNKKTKVLGVNKTFPKKKTSDNILFLHRTNNKFFLHDSSYYDDQTWYSYINELVQIPKLIKKKLQKKIVYRMHPSNRWGETEYLKKKLRDIKFDNYKSNLIDYSIQNSKIVVCTYLNTIFLQSLASNIPVLGFFDFKRCYITKKNFNMLKKLKKNKIIFDNYLQLCNHLNLKYSKIEEWWYSKNIQKIISEFKNNHAYYEKAKNYKITQTIKNIYE